MILVVEVRAGAPWATRPVVVDVKFWWESLEATKWMLRHAARISSQTPVLLPAQ